MLTAEIIQSLKRNNVSANEQLTIERTKTVLKGATRKQKNDIDELTGLTRVSLNRVYTTGSISARVAVSIAQIMNIDPFYLTGEANEPGELTDVVLNSFLLSKGYKELAGQIKTDKPKARRKTAKKAPAADIPVPAPAEAQAQDAEAPQSVELQTETAVQPIPEMTEDDAVQLLHALYLRVKYDESHRATLKQIQSLLA